MNCLDSIYGCGTPHTLLFHYKIVHKDKVSKCACGNQAISGNCVEETYSKLRGTASKCSNSNSSSNFSLSSSSNPNSDSNSNSNSSSKSNSIRISIPRTIPDPKPKNSHNIIIVI